MIREHKDLINDWTKYLYSLNSEFHLTDEFIKRNNLPNQQHPPGLLLLDTLLYNYELIKTNYQGKMDAAQVLTPFGKEIAKIGWDKYFTTIESDNSLAREIAASTLVLNKKIYPAQIALTVLLLVISIGQSYIFNEQLKVEKMQLQLQLQQSRQPAPQYQSLIPSISPSVTNSIKNPKK